MTPISPSPPSTGAMLASMTAEVMHPDNEQAVQEALSRFCEEEPAEAWPGMALAQKGLPVPLDRTEIVVLPLDRIGAPAGASGSKVFITYYRDKERKISPSRPFVIKIDKYDKMNGELINQTWPVIADATRNMALPFRIYGNDPERAVLISPFSSENKTKKDGSGHDITLSDLWHILHDKEETNPGKPSIPNWSKADKTIRKALETMDIAHRRGMVDVKRRELVYAEAFEWYLRDTVGSYRAYLPTSIFGEQPTLEMFGQSWPNPSRIVAKIIGDRISFQCAVGPIHGDLHPKNIVLDNHGVPHIIDFGWAKNEGPVIVDYLLLDTNLRATTLPSQMAEADWLRFVGMLAKDSDFSMLSGSVAGRGKLIQDILWQPLKEGIVGDWTKEYLIPMLLVSYGLLAHLDNARNQSAFVALVLSAARQVVEANPELA